MKRGRWSGLLACGLLAVLLLTGCGATYMKTAAVSRETGVEAFAGQEVGVIEKDARQYVKANYPVYYAGDYLKFLQDALARVNKQEALSLEENVLCMMAFMQLVCADQEIPEEIDDYIDSDRFKNLILRHENPPLVIEWIKFFSAAMNDCECKAEDGYFGYFFEGINDEGISTIHSEFQDRDAEAYQQWKEKMEAVEMAAVRAKVEELIGLFYTPEREAFDRVVSPIYFTEGQKLESTPLDEFYKEMEAFAKEEIDPNDPRISITNVAFTEITDFIYHREQLLVTRFSLVEVSIIEGDDKDSIDTTELLLLKINGEWRVMITP